MYYHTCNYEKCGHCGMLSCNCQQKLIDNDDNTSDYICPHCGRSMMHVTFTSNHTEFLNEETLSDQVKSFCNYLGDCKSQDEIGNRCLSDSSCPHKQNYFAKRAL